MRRFMFLGVALAAVLALPATTLAKAEQSVIQIVDETFVLEIEDPCTGLALHGDATENGLIRYTDLGDQGHHERVFTKGVVDFFDSEETFVGTWTYDVGFIDAFPPDAQGHVTYWLAGPMVYADGSRAIVRVLEQQTFGKGDVLKLEFLRSICGGGR